jgi:hypothetical protein
MMKKKFTGEYFLQQQIELKRADGHPMEIPIGGAIGLLALGDLGTIAWRQKRLEVKQELAKRTQANLHQNQLSLSITSKPSAHEQ